MNKKGKFFKQCFYRNNEIFAASKVTTLFECIDTAPLSFFHSFIVLPMIRCSKSAQKSAVRVCQVAIVVMETT